MTTSDSPVWPTMSIAEAHARLCGPGQPFEVTLVETPGGRVKTWAKAPPHLRAVLEQSRKHASLTSLVCQDDRVDFETHFRAAAHLARRLLDAGVRKGDRVAIAASNRIEWVAAFMAAVSVGAIATPLNGWWTGEELAYGLRDSGARVLFADGARMARLAVHRRSLPELALVVALDAAAARDAEVTMAEWIGSPPQWAHLPEAALPEVSLAPDDDATIFYTSGTTGAPKGALASHRAVASTVTSMGFSGERLRLRGGVLPPPPAQRAVLLAIPLFHVTGCFARMLGALSSGAKLVMAPKWDVDEAIRLIQEEQITATGGVPTIAIQLLDRLEVTGATLPSLQSLSFGGAPAPPDLVRRIRRVLPQVVPGCGFGMTETCSVATHHQGEEYDEAPDSCGPPVPICDLKIEDSNGRELGLGEVGQLFCRGANVFKGYWNKPEATAQVLKNGWLATGDLGLIDAEGRCTIVDRMKDVLIRGGENIYCIEVENVLGEFPGVKEAAVVGLPHPSLGEVPAAVLHAPAGPPDLQALRSFLGGRLAAYKIPERVVVSTGPLPRNAGGKIIKPELKRLFT